MKIAISATGNTLDSDVDEKFGRCKYFLILEVTDNKAEIINTIKNKAQEEMRGAGLCAGEQIGNLGVEAVITANLGPKAKDILDQLGIKAYRASGKIKDVLLKLKQGNLEMFEKMNQSKCFTCDKR